MKTKTEVPILRKPPWLKIRLPQGGRAARTAQGLHQQGLHTICEEGCCPNQGECFSQGVATFLILGDTCTRNCAFCNVGHGHPLPPDPQEPQKVADQTATLDLRFVVVTSVTRDDLPDGGAGQFAATIGALKQTCPGVGVEVLVPDFAGSSDDLLTVLKAAPTVLAHNLETVPRLYKKVRPGAGYRRSLELLRRTHEFGDKWAVKSGIMVGLGEKPEEVEQVMHDLLQAGCGMITIGQYLAPSRDHHPVLEYVHPNDFARYEEKAKEMGFSSVASGPLVRSSYLAEHFYQELIGTPKGRQDGEGT